MVLQIGVIVRTKASSMAATSLDGIDDILIVAVAEVGGGAKTTLLNKLKRKKVPDFMGFLFIF